MSAYQRNVLVGVVVLIGLGMLGWMVLQFAGKAASYFLTSGMKITLTAPRAEGLTDGSPITYKGVNVGRVTGVRRVVGTNDNEDILIDALIQADPPLPENLHGRIKQTSLLGGSMTIALEPIGDPSTMPTTKSTRSTQPVARGRLAENANLEADFVPDIASLGDSVRHLTESLQEIVGDPKFKSDISVSLANIRETTESARSLGKQLEKLSASLDKTAANADGTISEMRITVKDARQQIQGLSDNLNRRLQQVAESLQSIQSVVVKVDKGDGTAGKLINDPKLYESLADTASELKLAVKDIRRLIQQWEQEGIVKF